MLAAGRRTCRLTTTKRLQRAQLSTTPRHSSPNAAAQLASSSHVHTPPPTPRPDPFKVVAPQVKELQQNLLRLLGSSHPSLTEIASYYFMLPGKQLRPLLVLLMSRATNGLASGWEARLNIGENGPHRKQDLDKPLTSAEVLTDWNPRMPDHSASFSTVFSLPSSHVLPLAPKNDLSLDDLSWSSNEPHLTILPTQTRLAQIAEMIHVASLLHDDVLDASSLRRAAPSAPAQFGNKMSILGGDFLLGRTSSALSRLGDCEVVELISSVISNLIEGEVMQAREVAAVKERVKNAPDLFGVSGMLAAEEEVDRWTQYLRKTYFKTASLMAKSARAAVVLGGAQPGVQNDEMLKDVAYAYGRNMGIAFQVRPSHAVILFNSLNFCPRSLMIC